MLIKALLNLCVALSVGLNVNAPEFRPVKRCQQSTRLEEEQKKKGKEEIKEAKPECEWIFSDEISSIAQNSSTHGGYDDKDNLNYSSQSCETFIAEKFLLDNEKRAIVPRLKDLNPETLSCFEQPTLIIKQPTN